MENELSYSLKQKLIWLQGKKVAVCEPNAEQFDEMKRFVAHYGIEVIALNSAAAMRADLEQRRYATRRVFFAVFINANLAQELKQDWVEVIGVNPKLAKTPLILLADKASENLKQEMLNTGFFKYSLDYPVSATAMLRVLSRLNRWHAIKGDISPAVKLGE